MVTNDTTNRLGLIQLLEDLSETQSNTSSSYPLQTKVRDLNLGYDDYQNFVKQVSGTWQTDDSNHTKYPNVKFNLVSGQQDYSFTVDEQGNQVQDIYRVECKDSSGKWILLSPYNEMAEESSISEQETESGTPTRYYKTANGIFLDLTPNYNSTLGIRMWFTRSPNYISSNTNDISTATVTPTSLGIPNGHHRYPALKAAFWYWLPKDSQRASLYKNEILEIEKLIKRDVSNRNRDEEQVITSESINPY